MSSTAAAANCKAPHKVVRYQPNLMRAQAAAAAASTTAGASTDAATASAAAEEPPSDWMSLVSLILGVAGLMMRWKVCAWLAVFCTMASIANVRKRDMDIKQLLSSLLFAIMSLLMNYFGVPKPPSGAGSGFFG